MQTQLATEQNTTRDLQTQVATERDAAHTAIQDLRTQVANKTNSRTPALEQQLTDAQRTINALSRAAPTQGANHHNEKIPYPEKFDGTRSKLRPLLALLRIKAATYTGEQAKLCLAMSCLRGEALDQLLPHIEDD